MEDKKSKTTNTVNKAMSLDRARISVFRSNKAISAQIIDNGKTYAAASSKEIAENKKPVEIAFLTGELVAKKLGNTKINKISFDRNGYRYHGRVKALADGMRKGGLKF